MENHNIENSQDAGRPNIPVVNGEAKPSTGRKRKILLSLCSLILVAGLGTSIFLLNEEKQRANQFSDQAYGLLQEKAKNEADLKAATENPELSKINEAQTVYKAEVGKFTLALPGKYYVIEKLDGTFEGEPATDISVAINAGNGVISNPFQSNLSILAGANNFTDAQFSKYIKDKLKAHIDYKKTDNIKIDGQDTQVYEIDNFPPQKSIFFRSRDKKIDYEITVIDNSENFKDTQDLLKDTIEGFKFN
jgi:hypothetical protein